LDTVAVLVGLACARWQTRLAELVTCPREAVMTSGR